MILPLAVICAGPFCDKNGKLARFMQYLLNNQLNFNFMNVRYFALILVFWVTQSVLAQSQKVESFTLVNADTDQDIGLLQNDAVLDFSKLPTRNLNIRANTNPSVVGSVVFTYDGTKKTESSAPYALWGDNGGNYVAWTPNTGKHTLSATAYSGSNGSGAQGGTLTVSFTVVEQGSDNPPPVTNGVVSFTLVDASTDKDIRTLQDNEVIDLAALSSKEINIRANTNPSTVGSVKFVLSGAQNATATESGLPYALFGDANGNYNPWIPLVGSYTLTGTEMFSISCVITCSMIPILSMWEKTISHWSSLETSNR